MKNNGLLPTPQMSPEMRLIDIELDNNSRVVLEKRYLRRGRDGQPVETIAEMFWRVAYHVANAKRQRTEAEVIQVAEKYFAMLMSKEFFPNSPTFTGAGTPLGQLAACFVIPISDDMGKRSTGIFQTLRNAALVQQTGGGNGFSFSRLRPAHAFVYSSGGSATGPLGFMRVFDKAFGEVSQGGARRGANMAVLSVEHPDIEEFIRCKAKEGEIANFNISVGITDAFMRAVENDEEFELRFPDIDDERYREFDGTLNQALVQGLPIKVYKKVKARELFAEIVKYAHHNGEPGILFMDAMNRSNPVPHMYEIESTNPCGEQALGPFESCCLGSVNLSKHMNGNKVDWVKTAKTVRLAVQFLDDVIDANGYVPGVPQIREAALNSRRIGLGIMGLADMMFQVGFRYGSTEGQDFASQLMEFIRYEAMLASVDLAKTFEPFPMIKGSVYDRENMTWEAPKPVTSHGTIDLGRPEVDWTKVTKGIRKYGIRNAAQTTVAPTGTISTVAGCEGYGCEPIFALAYVRHVNDNGKDLELTYASPMFEKALGNAGFSPEEIQGLVSKVASAGTCKDVSEVPSKIRNVFVTAGDLTPEEHVFMQAALQAWVDNQISKTVNFPDTATEADVEKAYRLAWKMGCKGLTVYVAGSRDKVVLETKKAEEPKSAAVEQGQKQAAVPGYSNIKRSRPKILTGVTVKGETPLGDAYVTVNEAPGDGPFEVFITTAKAGSDISGISEALARLISYILRMPSPISPMARLKEVIRQMRNIGGSRSMGFGPNRVVSLPDGIARAMGEYVDAKEAPAQGEDLISEPPSPFYAEVPAFGENGNGNGNGNGFHGAIHAQESDLVTRFAEICPECGTASLLNEGGCKHCVNEICNHSEC